MNLDINNWKEFAFGRLICSIAKAKALNKDDLQISTNEKSGIRYITRTGENNGCEFRAELSSVDSKFIQEGNAITIGDTKISVINKSYSILYSLSNTLSSPVFYHILLFFFKFICYYLYIILDFKGRC